MRHLLAQRPAWRLAAGAILVSFAPVLVRTSASPPTTSAFYRMFLGGLMLLLIMLLRRQSPWVPRAVLVLVIAAGLAFSFDLFFWHRSIHLVGPGLATLLSGFQVFVLALVGIIVFGEKLRWQLVVSIPLALSGVAMIIGVDWSSLGVNYRNGVIFGLATAVCYSAYLLLMQRARIVGASASSPLAEVAWMSLACAVFLALMTRVTGESLAISSVGEFWHLAAYALLAQIGLAIISSSLRQVPTALIGLLLLLEPTFAYLWDVLFFSHDTRTGAIVGAVLALSAIYLGSRATMK